jgi:hypothetical protein
MLATMVMMGINRIVVTKGKISAKVNGVERPLPNKSGTRAPNNQRDARAATDVLRWANSDSSYPNA